MRRDRSTALVALALVVTGGVGLWMLSPVPSDA
jgi:hypothetical protein